MSWAREVVIFCDDCNEMAHGFGETTTVAAARRSLRKSGWKHTADGRDLCSECAREWQTAA